MKIINPLSYLHYKLSKTVKTNIKGAPPHVGGSLVIIFSVQLFVGAKWGKVWEPLEDYGISHIVIFFVLVGIMCLLYPKSVYERNIEKFESLSPRTRIIADNLVWLYILIVIKVFFFK